MNFLKFALFCLIIIISGSIDAQKVAIKEDPLEYFKSGKELYRKGIYAAAQDELNLFLNIQNVAHQPAYSEQVMESEFLYATSAMRLEQGNAEKLLISFVREYHPHPFASKAMIEIADYYFNERDYDQAIQYYQEIDLYGLSPEQRDEVRFKIAYSNFVKKDFRQARSQFQIIKNSENRFYYPSNYYYAMSNYFLEDYKEALKGFELVSNSRQYEKLVPYYISQIYFIQGEYQEVIIYAEEELKNDIRYKDKINHLLGQSLFKEGNYTRALPFLEEYATNNTLTPEDTYQLAFAQYKNKDYDKAIENFRKIAGEEGNLGQNANFYLADTYLKLEEYANARTAFAKASRYESNSKLTEESKFNYGKLSAELNYDREAVNSLQEIPGSSPYYKESQQILSDVFLDTRDYKHSIDIMESITQKSPDILKAYQKVTLYHGMQLYNNGSDDEALVYLNKSLDNSIDNSIKAQALFWKSLILHDKENYATSINTLNEYFTVTRAGVSLPVESSEIMGRYIQAYNYFKKKEYKISEGNFAKAISLIRLKNKRDLPDYISENILSDALLREGDALFKRNAYNQAVERYEQAIAIDNSKAPYGKYQKAIILGLQGDYVRKIYVLNDIIESHPNSVYTDDALLEAGKTYMAQNKNTQAIEPLRKLVKDYRNSSPLVIEGYLSLGLIAYNQGDVQSALNYYKKVFELNPTKEIADEAMTSIEEIYINDLSDPSGYVSFMEEVRGTSVESTEKDSITFRAAEISYESGNYDKAIRGFTNYLNNFPKGRQRISAHYQRAESHAVQQEYVEALKDYEYVVAQGPSSFYTKALEKAALISYNYTEEFDKASRYYGMLESKAGNQDKRFEAQIGGLRAAFRSGDSEQVLNLAQKVSANPNASEKDIGLAQYYIGMIEYERKNYDESINAFNQATKYSNNEHTAEARYYISKIYYNRKEFDLAEQLARKSYQMSSNYPFWVAKSLILLSDVLIEKDDLFNARAALEAVIENFTEDQDILSEAREKLNKVKKKQERQNPEDGKLLEMEEN